MKNDSRTYCYWHGNLFFNKIDQTINNGSEVLT